MVEKTSTNVETTYRLFGDHLGSLRAVVRTSDGVAVQWMRHGPWGEVEGKAVVGGFERVPFGFAGGNYDEITGLDKAFDVCMRTVNHVVTCTIASLKVFATCMSE